MLHVEWLRVCDEQPMPRLDTSRYQLEAPPRSMQTDLAAWQASVDNAHSQLEHQANRCAQACSCAHAGGKIISLSCFTLLFAWVAQRQAV